MSQQYPEPEKTQPGGFQVPYPYQPPPVKKRMSPWAIVGISVGSLFGFLMLLGLIGSTIDGDDKGTVASEAKAVQATVTITAAGPTATVTVTAKPVEPKKAVVPKTAPATSAAPKPAPPKPKPTPTKAPAKKAQKAKQYGDGDYIVGEDIPAGTYTSKGAAPGLFELCTITTDPTSADKFPQFKTANAKERIIIILTKADGVVTVQGCEPLTRR
ncbi:hypothetical protein ABZ348_15500 [Streptomyces sp. NPDC005963]|uniref:hypothetical protein n=1 Tax=Streptomyces sp. NPDC005963 TaxID=3156721 RepID=UPI0033E83A42